MQIVDNFFKHSTSVSAWTKHFNKCTNQIVLKVKIKICGKLRTIFD